ncbi:MAG TPA: aminoglycoside phosphotransferase family protein [Candidatus Limnocylindria bacterium]|nr:aminoglycoside phosphotransferase family protein [Candidatus Limnocylindria bacterium]
MSAPRERLAIPPGLDWWRSAPGGGEWLDSLPTLVADCSDRWQLQIGQPYQPASISLVIPAERADGTPAVLKVSFPEPESEHEAAALAAWGGRGAVRLLAHDPERRALLIERCSPGDQLWAEEDDDAVSAAAAAVMSRLWRRAPENHPFRLLADQAARWAVELPARWAGLGRPFEQRLLDEAVAACLELGGTQGEPVVLHQDLHAGNILRAQREPWLAIDPKPLVGERPFDAAALLRDRLSGLAKPDARAVVRRRLDILVERLGLDRDRTRRWGLAHALAWGVSGSKVYPDMIVAARSLAHIGP